MLCKTGPVESSSAVEKQVQTGGSVLGRPASPDAFGRCTCARSPLLRRPRLLRERREQSRGCRYRAHGQAGLARLSSVRRKRRRRRLLTPQGADRWLPGRLAIPAERRLGDGEGGFGERIAECDELRGARSIGRCNFGQRGVDPSRSSFSRSVGSVLQQLGEGRGGY